MKHYHDSVKLIISESYWDCNSYNQNEGKAMPEWWKINMNVNYNF